MGVDKGDKGYSDLYPPRFPISEIFRLTVRPSWGLIAITSNNISIHLTYTTIILLTSAVSE